MTRNSSLRRRSGELLLVDAGAEYAHYACDVTRTWPCDGKKGFTRAQAELYELVLDAQKRAIEVRCAPRESILWGDCRRSYAYLCAGDSANGGNEV